MIINLPPQFRDLEIHVQDLLSEVSSLKDQVSSLTKQSSVIQNTLQQLILDVAISSETKSLISNISGVNDSAIVDMTFNNLVPGEKYIAFYTYFMRSTTGAASTSIIHDGVNLGEGYLDTDSGATYVTANYTIVTKPFVATSNSITINTGSFTTGDTLFGSADGSRTNLTIIKLNKYTNLGGL